MIYISIASINNWGWIYAISDLKVQDSMPSTFQVNLEIFDKSGLSPAVLNNRLFFLLGNTIFMYKYFLEQSEKTIFFKYFMIQVCLQQGKK